ncbi:MAG TPA: hypothetical protein VLA16_07600, partial [Ideonella sp.]|nr:hypothetical protein [Ideonella sp.]
MKRRDCGRAGIASLILLAASTGHSQESPRAYAVLSLVGNELTVVNERIQVGSHLDQNVQDTIPIPDGQFDKAALLSANAALKRADAGAKVSLLAPNTPSLYEKQERFFNDGKLMLPDNVMAAIRQTSATRLLLLTKERDATQVQAANGRLGRGTLSGLGFYINNSVRMITTESRERASGFLGPYAYARLSM